MSLPKSPFPEHPFVHLDEVFPDRLIPPFKDIQLFLITIRKALDQLINNPAWLPAGTGICYYLRKYWEHVPPDKKKHIFPNNYDPVFYKPVPLDSPTRGNITTARIYPFTVITVLIKYEMTLMPIECNKGHNYGIAGYISPPGNMDPVRTYLAERVIYRIDRTIQQHSL